MCRKVSLISFLLLGLIGLAFAGQSVSDQAIPAVNSPLLRINYKILHQDRADSFSALWYRFGKEAWIRAKIVSPKEPIEILLSSEGVYDFVIKFAYDNAPPTDSDSKCRCLVDFSEPLVHITDVNHRKGRATVSWRAFDMYFSNRPIEIYLVNSSNNKNKLLGRFSNTGTAVVKIDPSELPARIKLVAIDRAGNYSLDLSEEIFPKSKKITTAHSYASTQPLKPVIIHKTNRKSPRILSSTDQLQAQREYKIGTTYKSRGENDMAVKHFKRSIELSPNFLAGYIDLADVLKYQGLYNKSANYYLKALVIDEHNVNSLQGLASVRIRQRKYHQARQCLEKLVKLDDKNIQGWLRHGDVCWMLGDKDQSGESWKKANEFLGQQNSQFLKPAIASRLKLLRSNVNP